MKTSQGKRLLRRFGRAVATTAVLGLLAGCGGRSPQPMNAERPAPEFSLQDIHGRTVRLSDSAGQVRLVDFWATWCPPCREAIPELKSLHARYANQGLTILAISMDDEPKEVVPPFVEKWEIPYTNLLGTEEVAEAFGGVFGLPTTFLVDRQGQIVDTFMGPAPKEVLEKRIRELLGLGATG